MFDYSGLTRPSFIIIHHHSYDQVLQSSYSSSRRAYQYATYLYSYTCCRRTSSSLCACALGFATHPTHETATSTSTCSRNLSSKTIRCPLHDRKPPQQITIAAHVVSRLPSAVLRTYALPPSMISYHHQHATKDTQAGVFDPEPHLAPPRIRAMLCDA